jgi:hypothetical protein
MTLGRAKAIERRGPRSSTWIGGIGPPDSPMLATVPNGRTQPSVFASVAPPPPT